MKGFELKQTQEWMQSALIDPYAAQTILNSSISDGITSLESVVKSTKKMSAREHLAIYQRSYLSRLRDCMAGQFSALEFALGEELFRQFADHYLITYPSKSYTLADLGEHFVQYLEETRPDKDEAVKEVWPDFMIELARFEFNLSLIFDEYADEKNPIADESTEDNNLRLIPVFYLFEHAFPISWYYKEFVRKNAPELPFPHKSQCAVRRKEYKMALYDIKPDQYYFLSFLKQGLSVEEAKNQMVKQFGVDRIQMDAVWSDWKKVWIEAGFFCSTKSGSN